MNLFRSATTVGGLTMVSRILGFVRDMLIAASLGTGPVADAFVVAFRFPNLFRRLFGEGAFNAAFVPLFAKALERDGKTAAKRFGEEALSVLFFALVIFTVLAEISMPWLIHVIAPGYADAPDKLQLTSVLTQIAFPYLMFMSLVALLSGVLNSLGRFAIAAAAPILLNIVLISVLLLTVALDYGGEATAGYMLVWGVSAAGLLQLVMLMIACARAGFLFKVRRPKLTPQVKRLILLGIPGVIAGGITQINLLIGTIIATLQDGAVSFLYYADRIYQLPLGVVGVAIGIVLLPDLSARLAARDNEGAINSQNRALEFSMMLTIPCAVALALIPQPILQVLFEHGAFKAADTKATADALAAFSLGLPAFVLIKIFSPGYFARENTKTPMQFAVISVVINVVGSLALYSYIGHVGIALATSLAGWTNAGLLWAGLHRQGAYVADLRLQKRLPLIILASVIMGMALWLVLPWISSAFARETVLMIRIGALAGLIFMGICIYFAAATILGVVSASELKSYMRRS